MLADRIYRTPRHIVAGQPSTGWLGLVSSWLILGAGATFTAVSAGGLLSIADGTCPEYSTAVCEVASLGGVIAGVVAIAVAVLFALVIARGFGPPVLWWVLPVLAGTASVICFIAAAAGTDRVLLWPMIASLALLALTAWLAMSLVRRGRAASFGWIRMDGLDSREVPMRSGDVLVLPLAALAAALVGGWLATLVSVQLLTG